MDAQKFAAEIVLPGLDFVEVVTGVKSSREAAVLLTAIALQESGCTHRYQVIDGGGVGPARSFFQFEYGGGVKGVITHYSSKDHMKKLCAAAEVRFDQMAIWRAIEGHDNLAVACARMLMLTDPYKLPTTEAEAYAMYRVRLWRPGKPHPEVWPANWKAAGASVGAILA